MITNLESKTFSFIEETYKCKQHSELVQFYCLCKQKLCFKCITEGVHLYQHPNVTVIPTKELRRSYISEVEDLELLFSEMTDGRKRGEITDELSELKHFNQKFTQMIKSVSLNYFNDMFKEESKTFKEVKGYMEEVLKEHKTLNSEQILEVVSMTREIKDKARFGLVSKYEKISKIQNIFIDKNDEFELEFRNLLNKFFADDKVYTNTEEEKLDTTETNRDEGSFFKIINSNINKIMNDNMDDKFQPDIENPEKDTSPLFQNSDFENPPDIIRNSKLQTNYKSNNQKNQKISSPIKTNNNTKKNIQEKNDKELTPSITGNKKFSGTIKSNSMWNEEMIMELSKSKLSDTLSYVKGSDIEKDPENDAEIENEVEGEADADADVEVEDGLEGDEIFEGEENELEEGEDSGDRSTDNLRISVHDEDSLNLSYDKKTMFTELATANENRNRIHKIIRKKTKYENKTIFEMFSSKKKTAHGTAYFSNKQHYNKVSKMNNFSGVKEPNSEYSHNHVTPTTYNQKANFKPNKEAGASTQCSDCGATYTAGKTGANWKKKCPECHKKYYGKKYKAAAVTPTNPTAVPVVPQANTNHYSYKAGKMNQTCSSCKTTFVVPVALAKQRKTCYYCFKAGK